MTPAVIAEPSVVSPLKRLRVERGLSLRDLADLVEEKTGRRMSHANLARLEKDPVNPYPATRYAICKALEVSVWELWPDG